jgi:hypothetical protein
MRMRKNMALVYRCLNNCWNALRIFTLSVGRSVTVELAVLVSVWQKREVCHYQSRVVHKVQNLIKRNNNIIKDIKDIFF